MKLQLAFCTGFNNSIKCGTRETCAPNPVVAASVTCLASVGPSRFRNWGTPIGPGPDQDLAKPRQAVLVVPSSPHAAVQTDGFTVDSEPLLLLIIHPRKKFRCPFVAVSLYGQLRI